MLFDCCKVGREAGVVPLARKLSVNMNTAYFLCGVEAIRKRYDSFDTRASDTLKRVDRARSP